jgi:hypothetical protein
MLGSKKEIDSEEHGFATHQRSNFVEAVWGRIYMLLQIFG